MGESTILKEKINSITFINFIRALCWEKSRCSAPSIMCSETEQGMAKLCIEFIRSKSKSSSPLDTSLTMSVKEKLSDKEVNESTPKVLILKGIGSDWNFDYKWEIY